VGFLLWVGVGVLSGDDVQSEILQRLTRVETKLDMQINAKDMAAEALQSAKSAHHRIEESCRKVDELDKHFDLEIKALNTRIDTENEKRKQGQRWMIGTMLTAAGLIIAAIKLF
jgi:predicted  nucleic acid-binding Zn-ribbon protein